MKTKTSVHALKPPFEEGKMPEHLHQLVAVVRGMKDPEMLDHFLCLNDDYHVLLRAALAKNEYTTQKTILRLLEDTSPIVVLAAISSKHATADALEPLTRHKNDTIRSAAATRMSEVLRAQEGGKSKSPAG